MINKKLILSKKNISLILFVILLISLIFLIQATITLSQTSPTNTNVTLESNNLTHLNVSNSSIVLYMPFDENYNSTFTYDYTNNSNDGTLIGGVLYNSSGVYGGAYTFDGVNDYIEIPASTSFGIGTAFTIDAWLKPNVLNAYGGVVSKNIAGLGTTYTYLAVVHSDGSIKMYSPASDWQTSSLSIVPVGVWSHVAWAWNNSRVYFYVNGISVGSGPMVLSDIATHTIKIGRWYPDASSYTFSGNIDEVMIWNTSLTSTEILAIYNNQTARFHGTGEMLFQNLNFGTNNTLNISLNNCQTNMGSSLRGKINNGNWANFSNCNITEYDAFGTGTLTNANLTVGFIGGNGTIANTFYTPLVIGNISFESRQSDATAPNISSIVYSPSSTEVLDPSTNITFSANVSDASNQVSFVTLQYYNGTAWANSTMSNNTLTNYTISIITVSSAQNYTFNIWANDSMGNSNHSINQTFSSAWDCTWLSTSDLGSTSGWDTNKFVGNLSINNTGDIAYSNNNCSLDFRLTYDLTEGRIYFDNSYLKPSNTYTISAKANRTIEVNASFLSEIKEEAVIITTQEMFSRSNTSKLNTTLTILSSQSGPYLYQKISSSPASVSLTAGNFSLEGYVRNLMGSTTVNENNTAYNVTFNWTLPSGFTNVSGNYKINFTNITDSDLHYNNINVSFSSLASMTSGVKTFYLYTSGVNISGNAIEDSNNNTILKKEVNITFSCYATSDSVCVTACGSTNDPDCTTSSTTTTSASSGGGGGGSAGPSAITGKSSAQYELVRGREQSFELEIQNQYSGALENLKISVSGIDKGLIEIVPSEISRIEAGKSEFLTIKIIAPSYFTEGSYVLDFLISGSLVSEDKSTKPYIGRKKVDLFIIDLSREEANKMKSDSLKMIEQMNNTNMSLKEVLIFYSSLEKSYEEVKFSLVKQNYESIKEVYDNAFNSLELIEELYKRIKDAEKRGISVLETKKLLFIGEVAFNRGDYSSSIKRLKEAKLTYALETKGEFNLFYAVKNNPLESSGILLGAIIVSFSSFLSIKYRLYKRKLKMLTEEEKLLLELMKVVQRETFEKNHLSMEEYGLAMSQYETKLSSVIEDKIKTETKLAHLFKIRGNQRALKQEKEKLYNLVKNLQDDYLNKGKIETRVYENMIKIYSARIIEIDERLIFIEAKEALRGGLKPIK